MYGVVPVCVWVFCGVTDWGGKTSEWASDLVREKNSVAEPLISEGLKLRAVFKMRMSNCWITIPRDFVLQQSINTKSGFSEEEKPVK